MTHPHRYPLLPDTARKLGLLHEYARLKSEYGSDGGRLQELVDRVDRLVDDATEELRALPESPELRTLEPDGLEAIRRLRPEGRVRLWSDFDVDRYRDRLRGSLLGRFAGCTLGAIVEFWSVEEMASWAAATGDAFPPVDYWSRAKEPDSRRYQVSECSRYTRSGMDGVPVDDDIAYTLLGLLLMEDSGPGFTVEEVGAAWLKYLPYACTAEEAALANLKAGIGGSSAADFDNPYVQWIGADIRADPWGYLAPGQPEKAAGFAHVDASVSHRRNGIYAEMYFSAAIAAAFGSDSVVDALRIGLQEIPKDCRFAQDVRWALEAGSGIRDYRQARTAVEERFGGMSGVHANLNACLTIFGLLIGGDDFTRVIGETVAMGFDNDCTAATAGSLFGAVHGARGIPPHWHAGFKGKVATYLNGWPEFSIEDVLERFEVQARRAF